MSTIPPVESKTKTKDLRFLAIKASNKAIQFRIVERFLSEIEKWLLKPASSVFDVELIKDAIQALKTSSGAGFSDSLDAAKNQLEQQFYEWERLIEEKDAGIETYNFRRFCDSSTEPLDNEIFVALATFYKSRPYTHSSQSKFDLVVTRLYTDIDSAGRRFLKLNPKEIARHIAQVLDQRSEEKPDRFLDNAGAVTAIHSFIAEAHGLEDFESLIECRLFERYREFKQELGEQYFEPMVVAAAVQCNAVFANAFNEMLEAASEGLNDILVSDIDIPAALHDASPESEEHLSGLLHEFFDFTPDDRYLREGKVSDHLLELLTLARENAENSNTHRDALTETPNFEFDVTRSARERLLPFLETLTKPEPDAGLLLGQVNRTKSLQNLNLSDFLYCEDHSSDMRSRRILGLILWSEEFLQNELGKAKTLTPTAQNEVLSLIQKSEEFATVLRSDISATEDVSKSRLLIVLNSLLESRLRLEGAIVRFTHRNLTPSAPVAQNAKSERSDSKEIEVPPIDIEKTSSSSSSTLKWLLWILLIISLMGAAYYFYPKDDLPTDPSVTERIDVGRLTDHEFFSAAYGRESTMFVTARDTWIKLPTEKQKESLRNLLQYQGTEKYDTVVLRDQSGHLLGNISAYGIYVPEGQSNAK